MELTLLSGAALLVLIIWELISPKPVIDLRLFARSRGFSISCALMFLVGFVLISSTQFSRN